ncbi:MAG: hypothetical protein WB948_00260 [Desulfobaccales bacterium]
MYSNVDKFLEGLPEIQQAIAQKNLSEFWQWEFAEIKDDKLTTEKEDFPESLDERMAFVGEFRRQHDKVIKFLTERTLVKLPPLFDLLSKNLEMAERFLKKGEPSPIEKIVQKVSDYLQNISNFVPLERVAFLSRDMTPPLLLCFTDDEDHLNKAFILVRGTLSHYFISFDILAKHFPEALVEAYGRQVARFEELNGQPIEQILFLVKTYGPVGPLLLSRLFKRNPHLKDKTFVKYSPSRKGLVDLFGEDRCQLLQPGGKVCTFYDLIFSGEGILKAKEPYKLKDSEYRVVVLFEDRQCPDRNESRLKEITYEILYPYDDVMKIIKDRRFDSTWDDTGTQFLPRPSAEEELQQPEKWLKPLWDFVTGLGTDNADTVTCAGYISQFFQIHLADDFQPYGRSRIESKSLSKKLYLLGKYVEERKPWGVQEPTTSSLEHRVGSLFKDYKFKDICLASLYLAYNKQKLTKAELARGEEILEEFKQKSHNADLSCALPHA